VFDIVGKRRWFFLFSTLVTIPGLVFILLTPITGGAVGLQFSIDYTGGTQWVIRFDDESVTPDDVKAVFLERGLAGTTVATTAEGFIDIRTEPLDLQEAPTPLPSPSPGASPRPSSAAGPQGSPSPSPEASASSSPEASAAASAEPSPSSSPEASPAASPEPSPSPVAPGAGQIPTSGQLGEIAADLEESFGPFEQAVLTTIGPIVSADLIQQALLLIAIGSIGILLWITVRFHDVKFGVSALVALVHDVLVVLGIFAILGTFLRVQVDGLFVTAMLTVIGFSVHDTIVVFDRVRENRARHAGEPFDPADARPVPHDQLHRHPDAAFAAALRWPVDHQLRTGAAHRDRLGDLFLHLRGQHHPGRVAGLGGPSSRSDPAGAAGPHDHGLMARSRRRRREGPSPMLTP
jgi:preprotein translocase subunit SecF